MDRFCRLPSQKCPQRVYGCQLTSDGSPDHELLFHLSNQLISTIAKGMWESNVIVIAQIWYKLMHAVDDSVAGGYVHALALICFLQYVVHLYRALQNKRQTQRYERQCQQYECELSDINRDRVISQLENRILREFVSETDFDRALVVLLRNFVPLPENGFCACVKMHGEQAEVFQSRGLSEESLSTFSIDEDLQKKVSREEVVILEGSKLFDSDLLKRLSRSDRRKVETLYLIAFGDASESPCILVTTTLYPAGADRDQQIDLVKRLMSSVAGNLCRTATLEMHEDQLRTTSQKLELRSISDRNFETPLKMLETFLSQLNKMLSAERISLYLLTPGGQAPKKALIRCGVAMQPLVQARWHAHENLLADVHLAEGEALQLDRDAIRQVGVESLVGSAIVAPLLQNRGAIGVLCVTRGEASSFDRRQCELAEWACEYLAETLLRVLNQASVELRSRQDALTELANRREFDNRILSELNSAEQLGQDCSLLLFDLDRFKSINDTYGHQTGDEVLRVVARVLQEEIKKIRSNDRVLVARYGGEEMAVLLPEIGIAGARRIAESVREAVKNTTVRLQESDIGITTSAGIATFPLHAKNAHDLIAAADDGLYQAKELGRDRVCCTVESLV